MKPDDITIVLQKHDAMKWLSVVPESGEAWVTDSAIFEGILAMGGYENAALFLDITVEEMRWWIAGNQVPIRFVPLFMKLINRPACDFNSSPIYILFPHWVWWPHRPSPEQLAAAAAFFC